MRTDLILRAAALLLVIVAGLPADAGTVRDMLGREVALDRVPERIISLAPSLTETIYALGAQERLAGVTTVCDFPPEATRKPKVGGMVNLSLEKILTLRPDLVLATTEGNPEPAIRELDRLGIPTYVVRPTSFSLVLESIVRVGRLVGQDESARRVVQEIAQRRDRVREATRARPRPGVLYLVWTDPVIVPGRDTLISDLIRLAGGESVSADERLEWPRLSLEQVIARAPAVIISGTHFDQAFQRWRNHGISLPAFRTGRVHTIDGDLLHRPGPRVIEGLEALARLIHPGVLP